MRYKLGLIVLALFVLPIHAIAQQSTSAEEKLGRLRLGLIDVQGKEAALVREISARRRYEAGEYCPFASRFWIDEARRVTSISAPAAGARKKSVLHQLETASAKRVQLEAEIALAETQAYHESAQPQPASALQTLVTRTSNTDSTIIDWSRVSVFAVMGVGIFLIRRFRSGSLR